MPVAPLHPGFGPLAEQHIPIIVRNSDFAWLISRFLTVNQVEHEHQESVPVWSAYHSLINEARPVTRIGAPPLLSQPAHEWSTLLTVLMRAQDISTAVVGVQRETVVSLDMGLYLPAKKLQMARNDLNHIILRPGELHIVMAMLKTIGSYIEGEGIDLCWQESELYGPATVQQILDGKHITRGQRTHMITLQALFGLYLEGFL